MANNNMELDQSQIINLAVNIFQNVGIKRYIGQIEALRHEDIYFEIYKIIFPDSMINIFKISQSNLTTGQKIQKIIQQISSIIKLDLYHISGQAIAQGNRSHLTNWLQLLQALSNNCIAYQTYHGGGSAPDRDREIYRQFEEDDFYTVQGFQGQFEKHVYTDQRGEQSESQEQQEKYIEKMPIGIQRQLKEKKRKVEDSFQQEKSSKGNKSYNKSQSSQNSNNVLKPIPNKKDVLSNKKGKNKRVTFQIDNPKDSRLTKNRHNGMKFQKQTVASANSWQTYKSRGEGRGLNTAYGVPIKNINQQERLLQMKKEFVLKMHKIEEEMERKKINDELAEFQRWTSQINNNSMKIAYRIEEQNQERTNYINKKIIERSKFVNSLSGKEEAQITIKQIFRKQRQNQKRMKRVLQQQGRKQALYLMDLNFAAQVQNMVMNSIRQ